MRKVHRFQLLTHKVGLSVRTYGEAYVIEIYRFLPEKSLVPSILHPVVREVRVETSTIMESAKATPSLDWLLQMLLVTVRRFRKSANTSMML